MHINKIDIKYFRCLRDASINCSNLTAFIGRNGAGKSAILNALNVFYEVSAPITIHDFYNQDRENTIEIRITFTNLNEKEIENFETYINNEKLIVTKKIIIDENGKVDQKYYGSAMQIPNFAVIRNLQGKSDQSSSYNEIVEAGSYEGLNQRARSADQALSYMEEYEQEHPELTEPIEREKQFIGPASIGGGSLDNHTKFVLIPAVKDASDETNTRAGSVYKLIDLIISTQIDASSENLTELPDLGRNVSSLLKRFSPGSEIHLNWDEVSLPDISLPSPIVTLVEDDYEGEISRKGHGLQRLLILTLLQYLASSLSSEAQNEEGVVEAHTPTLILAIEEPELYLHPSRCIYLSALFDDLSSFENNGSSNQILYCTHSPYFVNLTKFNQVRVVRKILIEGLEAKESLISEFSIDDAATRLSEIAGIDPDEITDITFIAHSIPVMNNISNEGFFGDIVVVVEGTSDVGILWQMEKILSENWIEKGVVVIPVNGKNNIDRPVVIFRGLSLPTYFVFDGDVSNKGKREEENTISRNHLYMKLAGVEIEDFPTTSINDEWAVFGDNIEQEIKSSIGDDIYTEIRKEVADYLGYSKPTQVEKNMLGASFIIQKVYNRGLSVPVLEELVRSIGRL